jgi:alpha-galactosidase
VLFESCASGGNRFDLGMLFHTPQIWASDNTDPISRLSIQEGLSYFYPMSSVGAHVSLSPHAQTVRTTPLWTRFNVAAFGVLGYELDPAFLSHREKKEIRKQVAFYKTHRKTFQYGTFRRFDRDEGHRIRFQAGDSATSVVGDFQTLAKPSPDVENLHVKDLDPDALYDVRSLDQSFSIKRLGHLVSHVLPIRLKPEGALFQILSRYVGVDRNKERFTASGAHLMHGVKLTPQFMGTDKNDATRVMGDHGSTLYVATRLANDGA